MMLELIVPDVGYFNKDDCCVSISGKFKRILLFKTAYEEMRCHHGKDFDYVQFYTDKGISDSFWIRPTIKKMGTSRILLNPKNGTRTISAAYLFKKLMWKRKEGIRFPLSWDTENSAAMVTITKMKGFENCGAAEPK